MQKSTEWENMNGTHRAWIGTRRVAVLPRLDGKFAWFVGRRTGTGREAAGIAPSLDLAKRAAFEWCEANP